MKIGKMFWVCFALVFTEFASEVKAASGWSYTDIPAWNTLSGSYCNGTKQSPIDIVESSAQVDATLGSFTKSLFTTNPTSETVTNNGHSMQVNLNGGYVINDPKLLPGVYKPTQFHFHWAASGNTKGGSEHTLNGNRAFAEMHIVHTNNNTNNPTNVPDGIAVLGFFVEAQGTTNNTAFDKLLNYGRNVMYTDYQYPIPQVFPISELLPADLATYYRYSGSLTTPMCNEVVVWTLFKTPIIISTAQKTVWQQLFFSNSTGSAPTPIGNNYRPVQPLNGRAVTKNSGSTASTVSPGSTTVSPGGGAGTIHPPSAFFLLSVTAILATYL